MSIAEKLTTIAENEQRVYEAGVQKGILSAIPTIYEDENPQWITESDHLFGIVNGVYLDVGELAVYKGLKIRAEIYNEEEVKSNYGYPIHLRIEDGAVESYDNLCICDKALNYNAEKKCFEAEAVISETPKNNQVKIGIWIDNENIEEISPFGHIKITTDDPDYTEYFHKRAEWNELWDGLQNSISGVLGNQNHYEYYCAFNKFIADENTWVFKPKYTIYPQVATSMFQSANGKADGTVLYPNLKIDLAQWLADLGVELDMSRCNSAGYMFYSAWIFTRLPLLDLSKCTTTTYMLDYNRIETIDGIISSETTIFSSTMFGSQTQKLTHCPFSGVIACNFNISKLTKLDYESLMSIVSCLKNISGEETTRTLTLNPTLIAKLEETEEGRQALLYARDTKGWTIVG